MVRVVRSKDLQILKALVEDVAVDDNREELVLASVAKVLVSVAICKEMMI
jgi:hypothetical protein